MLQTPTDVSYSSAHVPPKSDCSVEWVWIMMRLPLVLTFVSRTSMVTSYGGLLSRQTAPTNASSIESVTPNNPLVAAVLDTNPSLDPVAEKTDIGCVKVFSSEQGVGVGEEEVEVDVEETVAEAPRARKPSAKRSCDDENAAIRM